MAESKKIATRESFGMALCELAKDHDDIIVLDADLAAATKTEIFKKAYPDRFFDCGIAEGNMMQERSPLQLPSQCLPQEEHMSR